MPVFKFVVSNKKKSYKIEKETEALLNKKIGEKFAGEVIGLEGYELLITGGTDKDGFPMLSNIEGSIKKRRILKKGIGFNTNIKGLRKRKTIRGNTISNDTMQINCKVIKEGSKKIPEILGISDVNKKTNADKEKKENQTEASQTAK